jgi:hypothetical protein
MKWTQVLKGQEPDPTPLGNRFIKAARQSLSSGNFQGFIVRLARYTDDEQLMEVMRKFVEDPKDSDNLIYIEGDEDGGNMFYIHNPLQSLNRYTFKRFPRVFGVNKLQRAFAELLGE